jgi:pimeloyl-ACP methyl ester carboxylesterase
MNQPSETRYARNGKVHIAYRVLGEGPIDLIFVQGAFSHLDVLWENPLYRRFCGQLGSFSRLILFDKRGMGLSDHVEIGTLEERMEDVRAVMDAVGSRHAVLMGVSEGGPMSILFAATYPERTRALVLCGAEVKERATDDWPWGESTTEEFERAMSGLSDRWGSGASHVHFAPSLGDDERQKEWFGRLARQAAGPGTAEAFMRMAFDIDVRHVLPAVHVPTLVLHRAEDQICDVHNGRYIAEHVEGARYVELPGGDHLPWVQSEDIVAEIQEFLTGVRDAGEPDRVLATIMFTDIVRSTELAVRMGDRAWHELVDRHHALVRRELALSRGRELDTAGDGFFASFDGPARAIRCARSVVRGIEKELGVAIRAGLHAGECEVIGDKLGGIAVHIGARVAALAEGGEVLVSDTVRDLVAGSGLVFEARGTHALKGIPGERAVFAVAG